MRATQPAVSLSAERMVANQIEARGIRDPRVLEAMRIVPRDRFVSPLQAPFAWEDQPLPIGRGQTISQPYIVALMTESLHVQPTDRVLEVGAGSGYQAAILACLSDHVCALERDHVLAEEARLTLGGLGFHHVDLRCADGFEGWPEAGASFDAILVACAASAVPPRLLEQLAPGGRMVVPLGGEFEVQELFLLTRAADASLAQRDLGGVRFVPMLHGTA